MSVLLSIMDFFLSIPSRWRFRRAKKIFFATCQLLEKKKSTLDFNTAEELSLLCNQLKLAIQNKELTTAEQIAHELKELGRTTLKKSGTAKAFEFLFGIAIALFVAVIIRQTWFELYRIPTGSMRPTLKESDFLIVSKTNYGINYPLQTDHLYFDPNLMQRGDIIVFTGDQMDIRDVDTMYFYLFPGKKQFVKRLMGKSGDKLYFYGGLIYGIDKDGSPLPELYESKIAKTHEHIPFIKFEDKIKNRKKGLESVTTFYQMNQSVAKIISKALGGLSSELLQNGSDYFDLWGFKNFAMAKIVPAEQVPAEDRISNTSYYLKLQHHPSIKKPAIRYDHNLQMKPGLSYSYSYMPLSNEHLEKIQKALYTARFHVQNKKAIRYGTSKAALSYYPYFPKLDVPKGTYEFDNGRAYKEIFQGQLIPLSSNHPIYSTNPEQIKTLFNLGIEFDQQWQEADLFPSRYAYFRDGNFYLMGKMIFSADDSYLQSFLEYEKIKAQKEHNHHPFIDEGSPILSDGSLDIDFIKKYGLEIPEGTYLALGDNHAMSADSRDFGFVPEKNLKGKVSFVLFPFSSRWPLPMQPGSAFMHLPTVVIWGFFITLLFVYMIWQRNKKKKFLQ